MEPNAQIIAWLKDAHALEQSLENVLKRHIEDARDFPPLRERLKEHLEETRRHAARVQQCLESLGQQPSAIKSSTAGVMGAIQGMSTGMFEDELVKNALGDYAMEHFEIACYTALLVAAEEAGLSQIADAARDILGEEQAMADWLYAQLPQLTRTHLSQTVAKP